MAIVSSEIVNQTTQADGRIAVREKHIDHLAKEYFIDYLAASGADLNATLAQHAVDLWNNLCDMEITAYVNKLEDGVLPNPGVFVINYATLLNILRALVKRALRMQALDATYKAIGLMNWIKANYNNTQIASFLGVSTTVVVNVLNRFADLESKLKPLLDTDATKVIEVD